MRGELLEMSQRATAARLTTSAMKAQMTGLQSMGCSPDTNRVSAATGTSYRPEPPAGFSFSPPKGTAADSFKTPKRENFYSSDAQVRAQMHAWARCGGGGAVTRAQMCGLRVGCEWVASCIISPVGAVQHAC